MADGGAQPNRGANRSPEEIQRRRELSEAQSRDSVRERMASAGITTPPAYAQQSPSRYVDEAGEIPSEDRMRETLARNQASSQMMNQMSGIGGADGGTSAGNLDPQEKIQGQIDSVNHCLLVEILPEIVTLDIACLGLLTIITLPFVYWPTAALWGLEVYNDFRGGTTPLTPRLSWKSFASPGTGMNIDIPLPTTPLWIAWFAYVCLLTLLTVVWGGIIGIILYTWENPSSLITGAGQIFPFFKSLIGI